MRRTVDEDEADWNDDEDDENLLPATVPCPYCRKEVSEDAIYCPYCETYISEETKPSAGKPLWIVATVLICLVMVWAWHFGLGGGNPPMAQPFPPP
ncbi:MAG: hypothetical protein ACRDD1_02355 [Planctomycetia bacterium]